MKKQTRTHLRRPKRNKASLWALIVLVLGLFALLVAGLSWFNTQKTHQLQKTTQSSPTQSSKVKISQPDNDTEMIKDSSDDSPTKKEVVWIPQEQTVKVPILMYHGVHVMAPSEASNANNIVDPAVFESQLKALKEAGYYSLTPEEAYKVLTENVLPNNQKVVWITFDDSIVDFYTDAYPLLTKYQMTATNNVITGFVQDEISGSLTLSQILEMQANGMTFQSHTVTHPSLADSTADAQQYQLAEAKSYLDQSLNQETIAVAYPSGRYTDTTLSIAKSLGYKLGVTTNNGLASAADGLLSLNRIRVLPTSTPELLLNEIAY